MRAYAIQRVSDGADGEGPGRGGAERVRATVRETVTIMHTTITAPGQTLSETSAATAAATAAGRQGLGGAAVVPERGTGRAAAGGAVVQRLTKRVVEVQEHVRSRSGRGVRPGARRGEGGVEG